MRVSVVVYAPSLWHLCCLQLKHRQRHNRRRTIIVPNSIVICSIAVSGSSISSSTISVTSPSEAAAAAASLSSSRLSPGSSADLSIRITAASCVPVFVFASLALLSIALKVRFICSPSIRLHQWAGRAGCWCRCTSLWNSCLQCKSARDQLELFVCAYYTWLTRG